MLIQTPPDEHILADHRVGSISRDVNGWLKIKEYTRLDFFITKRRVTVVQLDEPPIEGQA